MEVFTSVIFTCNGELDKSRINCVSVVSFVGIRFKMAISMGRISCKNALSLSITKIFSSVNILYAGSSLFMTMGIA